MKGIPKGLLGPLLGILEEYYGDSLEGQARVAHLALLTDRVLKSPNDLRHFARGDLELLLDAVDHALHYPDLDGPVLQLGHDPAALAKAVKSFLDDARSAYDVTEAGWPRFELAWRQPPELTELVEQATSARFESCGSSPTGLVSCFRSGT